MHSYSCKKNYVYIGDFCKDVAVYIYPHLHLFYTVKEINSSIFPQIVHYYIIISCVTRLIVA